MSPDILLPHVGLTQGRVHLLEAFLRDIASSPRVLTEFDENLWTAAIDRMTVMLDDRLVFRFKDGTEVVGGQ